MRIKTIVDCSTCERIVRDYQGFGPAHEASPRCQSGGHSHCSCGTCF